MALDNDTIKQNIRVELGSAKELSMKLPAGPRRSELLAAIESAYHEVIATHPTQSAAELEATCKGVRNAINRAGAFNRALPIAMQGDIGSKLDGVLAILPAAEPEKKEGPGVLVDQELIDELKVLRAEKQARAEVAKLKAEKAASDAAK